MENFNDIKKLSKESKEIGLLFDRYNEAIKKSNCDKHKMGFNEDSRFSLMDLRVSLDAYTGYYGNSSCSTFGSTFSENAKKAFISTLNDMMAEILIRVSEKLKKEAENKIKSVKKDMEFMQSLIDSFEKGE